MPKLKTKKKQSKIKSKIKLALLIFGILILLAIITLIIFYSLLPAKPRNESPGWGVTYSARFAKELKIDWQKTLISILDDLEFRYVRLPVYWDEIEPVNNEYDFEELDWIINEIEKRNGNIVLVIGRKNLRWPECYEPEWIQDISQDKREKELLEMIEFVVNRYKNRKSIYMWQVENEAMFPFGRCPKPKPDVFKTEINLVRSLDSRPIMLTDSGELSLWQDVVDYADVLGITMYRDVSNPLTGDFHWPTPPELYSRRAWLAEKKVDKVIVAELQMEPWYNVPFTSIPVQDQYQKFDADLFDENIEFAKESGFETFYIWGVEWWYYMKKHNFPILYEKAKNKF